MESSNNGVFVHGTVTIDKIINNSKVVINGSNLTLVNAQGVTKTFKVLDGPIINRQKYKISQSLEEDIDAFSDEQRPGGGGFNSASHLRYLDPKLNVIYLSFSKLTDFIKQESEKLGMDYRFLCYHSIQTSLIIGAENDRMILTSPFDGEPILREEHFRIANEAVDKSSAAILNSAKDPDLVSHVTERAREKNVSVYLVATNSLDSDFIFGYVMPRATLIIGCEDMLWLNESNPLKQKSSKENSEQSLEMLKKLRKDKNVKFRVYLTMGSYGDALLEDRLITHIQLYGEPYDNIQEILSKNPAAKNRAGDWLAASIVHNEIFKGIKDPVELMTHWYNNSFFRLIGYEGNVSQRDFLVERI